MRYWRRKEARGNKFACPDVSSVGNRTCVFPRGDDVTRTGDEQVKRVALFIVFLLVLSFMTVHPAFGAQGDDDISAILAELNKKLAVKTEAVKTVKFNLKLISDTDNQLKSVDRRIENLRPTIEQNRANCNGTYKEPEYSYWLKFCGSLQRQADDLYASRNNLVQKRAKYLSAAQSAERTHDTSDRSIKMLLARLRVNMMLKRCECSGKSTMEATVTCYRVCYEGANDPGHTVPSPVDNKMR